MKDGTTQTSLAGSRFGRSLCTGVHCKTRRPGACTRSRCVPSPTTGRAARAVERVPVSTSSWLQPPWDMLRACAQCHLCGRNRWPCAQPPSAKPRPASWDTASAAWHFAVSALQPRAAAVWLVRDLAERPGAGGPPRRAPHDGMVGRAWPQRGLACGRGTPPAGHRSTRGPGPGLLRGLMRPHRARPGRPLSTVPALLTEWGLSRPGIFRWAGSAAA